MKAHLLLPFRHIFELVFSRAGQVGQWGTDLDERFVQVRTLEIDILQLELVFEPGSHDAEVDKGMMIVKYRNRRVSRFTILPSSSPISSSIGQQNYSIDGEIHPRPRLRSR